MRRPLGQARRSTHVCHVCHVCRAGRGCRAADVRCGRAPAAHGHVLRSGRLDVAVDARRPRGFARPDAFLPGARRGPDRPLRRLHRALHGRRDPGVLRLPARARGRRRAVRAGGAGHRRGVRRHRGRGAPGDRHRPGGGRRSDRRRCLGGTDGGGRDAQPGGAPASARAPGRDRHLAGHPRSVARALRRRSAGSARPQGVCRSGARLRGQAGARRREPLRSPPPRRAGPADRTGTRAGPAGGSLGDRPRRGRPGGLARRRGGPRQVAPAGGAGARDRREAHHLVRLQASPHQQASPLRPAIDWLSRAAGWLPGDPPARRFERLEAIVPGHESWRAPAAPRVAAVAAARRALSGARAAGGAPQGGRAAGADRTDRGSGARAARAGRDRRRAVGRRDHAGADRSPGRSRRISPPVAGGHRSPRAASALGQPPRTRPSSPSIASPARRAPPWSAR